MMLQGPEILLILAIIIIVFGLGKLSQISKGLARLRLNFEKGIATDYIEVTPGGEEPGIEAQEPDGNVDSSDNRGA